MLEKNVGLQIEIFVLETSYLQMKLLGKFYLDLFCLYIYQVFLENIFKIL